MAAAALPAIHDDAAVVRAYVSDAEQYAARLKKLNIDSMLLRVPVSTLAEFSQRWLLSSSPVASKVIDKLPEAFLERHLQVSAHALM
jgi:hypothetical protein